MKSLSSDIVLSGKRYRLGWNIPYGPSEGIVILSQRWVGGWVGWLGGGGTIQRLIIVIIISIIIIISIVIVIIIIVVVRSLSLFLLLNVHLSTFHMFLHDEGFLMRNYYLTLS